MPAPFPVEAFPEIVPLEIVPPLFKNAPPPATAKLFFMTAVLDIVVETLEQIPPPY